MTSTDNQQEPNFIFYFFRPYLETHTKITTTTTAAVVCEWRYPGVILWYLLYYLATVGDWGGKEVIFLCITLGLGECRTQGTHH